MICQNKFFSRQKMVHKNMDDAFYHLGLDWPDLMSQTFLGWIQEVFTTEIHRDGVRSYPLWKTVLLSHLLILLLYLL